MVKGYCSSPIFIQRGTRQGCPLSPLLFILALEPLAIKISASINIQGIICGNCEHKCVLFADYILKMVSSPVTTLPNLYAILKPFTAISGLKIDHDKAQAMNISLKESTLSTLKQSNNFIWHTEVLPYLGINVTPTLRALYSKNYPALF